MDPNEEEDNNNYDDNDYAMDEYDDYAVDNENDNIEKLASQNEEYELLKLNDFKKKREEQINEFAEFCNLPPDEAEIILINYNWDFEKLTSPFWFENKEQIKIKSGVEMTEEVKKKYKQFENTKECLVCYEEFGPYCPKMSLKCGHCCCRSCFHDHLAARIDDRPLEMICTPCPQVGCNLIVPHSFFEQLLENDKERKKKYKDFLMKNFTELNPDIKNCPNPKCDVLARVPGHGMKEIKCICGEIFCFKCLKESHRPCDCEMAKRWIQKNKDNDLDSIWLKTYTKQCPKCKKHIEKNQGCNHMTCRKEVGGCGYEFCWICLDEWSKHGTEWYKCKYKKSEFSQEEQKEINQNKALLERFRDFGEKYAEHQNGQKFANDLIPTIKQFQESIVNKKNMSLFELKFMDDAIVTIIDCRRMLKYSYAYGYYLKNTNDIKLFEHNQYMLDKKTDSLHEYFEKGPLPKIIAIDNYEEFNKALLDFRGRIINLMGTIQTFKQNLLDDIEIKLEKNIDYDLLYGKKL